MHAALAALPRTHALYYLLLALLSLPTYPRTRFLPLSFLLGLTPLLIYFLIICIKNSRKCLRKMRISQETLLWGRVSAISIIWTMWEELEATARDCLLLLYLYVSIILSHSPRWREGRGGAVSSALHTRISSILIWSYLEQMPARQLMNQSASWYIISQVLPEFV